MERGVFQRKVKISDKVKQKSGSVDHMKPQTQTQHENSYGLVFWISLAASQAIGVSIIIILIHWGTLYGGFVATNDDLLFNYHPLFMVLGLVIFYGDSIILYRALSFLPKLILKIIHAALHFLAIIFSSLGLVAVFENHRKTNKADLYSLHSWIGLITFIMFCLQYLGSFVAFLFPGLPPNWRAKIMPFHTFFGIGLFVAAVGTAEMGITEKLLFTKDYSKWVPEGVIGNVLGVFILVFAFLITFMVTHSSYKRKPLPSEMPSAASVN